MQTGRKMNRVTDDLNSPELPELSYRNIPDPVPTPQQRVYAVLSANERAKPFVRPLRDTYIHAGRRGGCGRKTVIRSREIIETLARDPTFYSGGYCIHCCMHRPNTEFEWLDGTEVEL